MNQKQKKLVQMLEDRNPLPKPDRKSVKPVDLYAVEGEKSRNQKKPLLQSGSEKQSKQNNQPKKFASYLRENSIKELKYIAIERGMHDYEILQEAVDAYLKQNKRKE